MIISILGGGKGRGRESGGESDARSRPTSPYVSHCSPLTLQQSLARKCENLLSSLLRRGNIFAEQKNKKYLSNRQTVIKFVFSGLGLVENVTSVTFIVQFWVLRLIMIIRPVSVLNSVFSPSVTHSLHHLFKQEPVHFSEARLFLIFRQKWGLNVPKLFFRFNPGLSVCSYWKYPRLRVLIFLEIWGSVVLNLGEI